jgi:hypothetical protein
VFFEIVSEIAEAETFATGNSIRELPRLHKPLRLPPLAKAKKLCGRAATEWYDSESGGSLVRSFRI